MIRIISFKVLNNQKIHSNFSDGIEKTIDFTPFIAEDKLSKPLSDPAYFKKAALYENGRGIFWPNDYDFCPDFLREYKPDEQQVFVEKN